MRWAAGELKYSLSDLHWNNVGVTAKRAVLILGFETCTHSPHDGPRRRWNNAVKVWLAGMDAFAHQIRADCSWRESFFHC